MSVQTLSSSQLAELEEEFAAPPAKSAGQIIEDEDTNDTVEQIIAWLDERKLLS